MGRLDGWSEYITDIHPLGFVAHHSHGMPRPCLLLVSIFHTFLGEDLSGKEENPGFMCAADSPYKDEHVRALVDVGRLRVGTQRRRQERKKARKGAGGTAGSGSAAMPETQTFSSVSQVSSRTPLEGARKRLEPMAVNRVGTGGSQKPPAMPVTSVTAEEGGLGGIRAVDHLRAKAVDQGGESVKLGGKVVEWMRPGAWSEGGGMEIHPKKVHSEKGDATLATCVGTPKAVHVLGCQRARGKTGTQITTYMATKLVAMEMRVKKVVRKAQMVTAAILKVSRTAETRGIRPQIIVHPEGMFEVSVIETATEGGASTLESLEK